MLEVSVAGDPAVQRGQDGAQRSAAPETGGGEPRCTSQITRISPQNLFLTTCTYEENDKQDFFPHQIDESVFPWVCHQL